MGLSLQRWLLRLQDQHSIIKHSKCRKITMVLKIQLSKYPKPGDSRSWQSIIILCDAAHKAPHKPQTALLYYLLLFVISSWAEASDSQMGFWWFLSLISLKDYIAVGCQWLEHSADLCPSHASSELLHSKEPRSAWAQPGQEPRGTHRWQAVVWGLAPACLQLIVPGPDRPSATPASHTLSPNLCPQGTVTDQRF